MIKLFISALFIIYSTNSYAINYEITPKQIENQAQIKGWQTVLHEIFNDQTAANMVLLAIDSGERAWLKLATTMLLQSTNPRTQKMLVMSLGEALQWQPKKVFDIALKQVPIENLCSLEGVYEWRLMSRFLALTAINRRIEKLKQINDFKFAKTTQTCITQLEKAKTTVTKQLTNQS